MKLEWRKQEADIYIPKKDPSLITVPKQKFFSISGNEEPGSDEYSEKIGVLYSLSYAIRMMPKQGYKPDGYCEYTVYPLECIWNCKSKYKYTIMIRQPDFVTQEIVDIAFDNVKKKKPNRYLDDVKFEVIDDDLCVQILHEGSFDTECRSFEIMDEYCKENNLQILKDIHHREIYLSDARRVAPEKLKIVLRYKVKK